MLKRLLISLALLAPGMVQAQTPAETAQMVEVSGLAARAIPRRPLTFGKSHLRPGMRTDDKLCYAPNTFRGFGELRRFADGVHRCVQACNHNPANCPLTLDRKTPTAADWEQLQNTQGMRFANTFWYLPNNHFGWVAVPASRTSAPSNAVNLRGSIYCRAPALPGRPNGDWFLGEYKRITTGPRAGKMDCLREARGGFPALRAHEGVEILARIGRG